MILHFCTAVLAMLLTAICLVDLRTLRIPDILNALLLAAGLAANIALQRDLVAPLLGVVLGYVAIVVVNELYFRLRGHDGIGRGDAKLLAGAGAWVGWSGLPFVVLIGSALGLAIAVTLRARPKTSIAFGPFLGVGLFAMWIATGYF